MPVQSDKGLPANPNLGKQMLRQSRQIGNLLQLSKKILKQIDNAKFDPEALPPIKLKDLQPQGQFRLMHVEGYSFAEFVQVNSEK